MKKIKQALFLMLLLGIYVNQTGCKKIVDDAQQSAINAIISDGQWKITKFLVGSDDLKNEYANLLFQFYNDGKVIARETGSAEVNGTWSSNTANLTITSNFPGAVIPISRFNGTWLITRVTETLVEAAKDVGGVAYKVKLQKN